MPLPVTAVFAGLLALWLMFLQARVIAFRGRRRVALGDGGLPEGERLTRAHANAAENIPVFLILLGLAEASGAAGWAVALLGATFLAGRVLHGLHFVLDRPGFALRAAGMVLTLVPTGLAALGAIGFALAG
jgi:uncharacterized membrane protein YecN with MAPEG domain